MSVFISSTYLNTTAIKSMPEILIEQSKSTTKTIVWKKKGAGMDKAFYVNLSELYGVMFCNPRVRSSEVSNHKELLNIIPDFLPKLQVVEPKQVGNFIEELHAINHKEKNKKVLALFNRRMNENNEQRRREYEPAYKTEVIKFIAQIKPIMHSSNLNTNILPIIKEVKNKQALYNNIENLKIHLNDICQCVGELTFVIEEQTHDIKLIDLATGSEGNSAKKNQQQITSGLINIQNHIDSKYLNNKNNVELEYSRLPKSNTMIYGSNYK